MSWLYCTVLYCTVQESVSWLVPNKPLYVTPALLDMLATLMQGTQVTGSRVKVSTKYIFLAGHNVFGKESRKRRHYYEQALKNTVTLPEIGTLV